MPIKKEREYRALAAPLTAQAAAKRIDTEYYVEGYATTFTITVVEPCKCWEFDMENDNMKGHWTGVFTQKGKQTEIDFTENIVAKKLFMKPFVKSFLKKQQALYVSDLKKALL